MTEWMHSVLLRLRALLRYRRLDDDLRDEMTFHLAMREAQLGRAGTAHADAEARRRFGNRTRIAEELREGWTLAPRLGTLGADFRHALRGLRRQPAFAIVVILTLSLGIGINTATFSIVNAALLKPLGFAEPDRLVAIEEHLAGFNLGSAPFSPPDFVDLQREQQSFTAVAAYQNTSLELSAAGEPVVLDVARVSVSTFPLLGVPVHLGRTFTAEEERPGVAVAILSWELWHARFAGDSSIVGRSIMLDRRPYAVVGVMPGGFEFPRRGPQINNRPADLWVPLAFTAGQLQGRGNQYNHSVVARLKPGVALEQAQAELALLGRRINERYPPVLKQAGFAIALSAAPLRDAIAGRLQRPLLLLLMAVGLVLLVACANIANLVLSRAASRSREVALRTALGSSRARLLQLLLAEAMVLSIAGAAAGVAIAAILVAVLPATVADSVPAAGEIGLDMRVLLFSAGLAVVTSLIFALIPLVTLEGGAPGRALQEEAVRTTPGIRRHRIQAALVVSTVALACVLLAGAGLFIRSFGALMASDAGFSPDNVLTAAVALPRAGYERAASVRAFHDSLLRRTASLPGVRSTALTTDLPLERYERRTLSAEGVRLDSAAARNTNLSWIRGPYFATLGIRFESGRPFTDIEDAERRNVVIVNQRLASVFWPGQNAIGKRLRWGLDLPENPNPWLTVVGVVDNVVDGPLGSEPYLHAWEPFIQFPDGILDNSPGAFGRHAKVALKTNGDPRSLASALRTTIGDLDSHLAVQSISTMTERLAEVVAPRRFSMATVGAFAAGALLLAGIGLYGLLAFSVSERRREIAVRLALGAEPPAIVRMVVTQGLTLVSIGLVLGVAIAFAGAGVVDSFLYRTESRDVVAFGAVPVLLSAIALVACALPAYRASRVQSLTALRAD
jgi:putative ABC transport system permease protein